MEAGDVAERARQRELVRRGYDAISGRYLGADMFWDHADTATYVRWFAAARLAPVWHRFIPEGDGGHGLILAQSSREGAGSGASGRGADGN